MATFIVSNLNNSGTGSLREALVSANASSDTNVSITFSVAGTITLSSALPEITRTMSIDATSAPGYAPNGAPVVTLDFSGNDGLTVGLGATGSSLLGLAIGGANADGILLQGGAVTIDKCYVGLAGDGTDLGNGRDGIRIQSTSSNNKIGLNESEAAGVVSNVISSNTGNGITIQGGSGNVLVANRIGTNADGTTEMGNGENGVHLTAGTTSNTIGGTVYVDSATGDVNNPTGDKGTQTPVFVVPPLGNQISANGKHGVLIDARSENNVLNGNFIGTTADGNADLGNTLDGVLILDSDNNALIGCTFVDEPFVYYNVLSGNGGNGLHITNSDNVVVQANFFGVGANNASLVGNDGNGILVDGDSEGTTVGGVIPLGNVSGGNRLNGIYVTDTASDFITFNTFGGLFAFQGAAPNGQNGVKIDSTGGGNELRTNVLSGNLGHGIEISGNARDVLIDPNIVGLDTVGNAKLANGGHGLLIGATAHDITVGGTYQSVIPQNTFSGNAGYGVAIVDAAYDVHVFNSVIGASSTGRSALGNTMGGVLLASTGSGNQIGGITIDPSNPQANYIGGNDGNGVTFAYGSAGQSVISNVFGTDESGRQVLPNGGQDIAINGTFANIIHTNTMTSGAEITYGLQPQALYSQMETLYIGYFGRAADPDGFDYWAQTAVAQLLEGASVQDVMEQMSAAFATSTENAAYASLATATLDRNNAAQVSLATDFINQTYAYFFNRVPDTEGFEYWFNELFDGVMPYTKLVYAIANGSLGDDQVVLANKAESALYFNQMLEAAGIEQPSILSMQQAVRGVTTDTTLYAAKLATDTYTGESDSAVTNTMAFNDGTFITGVRGDHDGNVILTGDQVIAGTGNTQAILYHGPMLDTSLGKVYQLTPTFEGQQVVSSTFYGPNTSVFDATIELGQVRAVGSYVNTESVETRNHGMIYEGSLDGTGTWTQVDVPSSAVGGAQVWNTILHSNMGDLAVGNYDLYGQDGSGNAFIYNMRTETYTILDTDFGGTDQLTTLYGIWQEEHGGHVYVVVGGSKHGIGANDAFMARYDSISETFSDIRYYTYEGTPGVITHFEGVTGVPGGYNLIATTDAGAAFASVAINLDGSFGDAQWTLNNMPGASLTTGNSVFQNVVMGIYQQDGVDGTNTYVGTVDQSIVSDAGGLIMPVGASNLTYGQTALASSGAVVIGATNAGNVLGGSIGNDTFQGVQQSALADSIYTGGGADQIVLFDDRTVGSHIALYASNMSSDVSKAVAGTTLPSLLGSIVNAQDVPQLGWWGQGSGQLGGPVSDASTNAGAGTGTSESLTTIYNFETGGDLAELDRLDISLAAFSDLLRDVNPGAGPGLGQAIFSNLLAPGGTVTVTDANVLVFDSTEVFANASDLAAILADGDTDIDFGALQTDTLNHYLIAYQDTTGSTRIADLNIQSEADFRNTEVIADKTVSISDMVRLVDVSIDQLYDGNIHFVA